MHLSKSSHIYLRNEVELKNERYQGSENFSVRDFFFSLLVIWFLATTRLCLFREKAALVNMV